MVEKSKKGSKILINNVNRVKKLQFLSVWNTFLSKRETFYLTGKQLTFDMIGERETIKFNQYTQPA